MSITHEAAISDILRIPSERMTQLRQISKARAMPIADLIAEFVQTQIDAAVIGRDIPGFTITRSGDAVTVATKDWTATLEAKSARDFAAGLRGLDRVKAPRFSVSADEITTFNISPLTQAEGGSLEAFRAGASIQMKPNTSDVPAILAPSIARDLAGWISAVAK